MKKILALILTTGLLLVMVSFGVMAKGRNNSEFYGGRNRLGHQQMRLGQLDLSADQEKQILTIRQEFQKETQNLRFEHQKLQLELRQLWEAQSLDQKELEAKTKAATALEVQLAVKNQEMFEKIKKVLTPEQIKKVDTLENGPDKRFQKRTFKGKGELNHFGKLGLTADQQKKVLDIQQKFQKDTQPLQHSLQQKQLELRQLLETKPLNQKQIEAKSQEVAVLQVQLRIKSKQLGEELKKVLTKAQLDELNNKPFGPKKGRGCCNGQN